MLTPFWDSGLSITRSFGIRLREIAWVAAATDCWWRTAPGVAGVPVTAMILPGRGKLNMTVRRAVDGMDGSAEEMASWASLSRMGAICVSFTLRTRGPRLSACQSTPMATVGKTYHFTAKFCTSPLASSNALIIPSTTLNESVGSD